MRKTTMIVGTAMAVAVAGTLALVVWPGNSGPAGRADPSDAPQVALGHRVYEENCASCHGRDLQGDPNWRQRKPSGALPAPPHDASGHTWHHPDQQLFAITKQGVAALAPPGYVSDMPGFEGTLSDAEIWAVLAYIKSRWPEKVQDIQAARTAAAARGG